MKQPVFDMDFRKVEERLMADLAAGDNIYSAASKLPRRHPARFALLYGMGPKKLLDLAEQFLKPPSVPERELTLECELRCFENWQENETVAAVTKHHAENGAIAYAAMEEGIAEAQTHPESPTAVNSGPAYVPFYNPQTRFADFETLTGRRWAPPPYQWPLRNFLVQSTETDAFTEAARKLFERQPKHDDAAFCDLETIPVPTFGIVSRMSLDIETNKEWTPLDGVASNHNPVNDVVITRESIEAAIESFKGWCRCDGRGYWYEQIDGPNNQRKVRCPKGCPDMSLPDYPEEGILRD